MKPNNDFRLLLAMIVCVVHSAQLSAAPALGWVPVDASTAAVLAFFALSGHAMAGSFERSRSVPRFLWRRVLRIYPAYAATVLCASAALVALSPGANVDDWLRYLAANLAFANWVHPGIVGVFCSNRIPAINGALWTMKCEVVCYAAVPALFAVAHRVGWAPTLAVLVACGCALGAPHGLLLASFACGLAWHRWRGTVGVERAPRASEDLSYGVYLTHFPIVQGLVAAGAFAVAPNCATVLALAGALGGALALRHGVERPVRQAVDYFGVLFAKRTFLSSLPLELPK
jgi:peptidoglycan/LPS O-acetylase OafA/YrhL